MDNKNSIPLDDLLRDARLTGTEKLWREIFRICDEFFLLIKFDRYPLTAGVPQFKVTIYGVKQNKWYWLFEENGMELQVVLSKLKKQLEDYKMRNKEYQLHKPGGGEMVW